MQSFTVKLGAQASRGPRRGSPAGVPSLPAMSAASARTITHTLVRDYFYPRQCFLLETGIIIIRHKFIHLTLGMAPQFVKQTVSWRRTSFEEVRTWSYSDRVSVTLKFKLALARPGRYGSRFRLCVACIEYYRTCGNVRSFVKGGL